MKTSEQIRVGTRSLWNRAKGWPVCVSFEVTHSCCADCHHCDKGGIKSEAKLLTPADYARYSRELRPGVCQLSGGEPLLREDLVDELTLNFIPLLLGSGRPLFASGLPELALELETSGYVRWEAEAA